MNPVSVKTQRLIMYIPLVNVVNMFICIYNHYAVPNKKKNNLRSVGYLLSYSIPAAIGYSLLYRLVANRIPAMEPLLYALGIYLVPLIMSFGLIKFQEKYIFPKAK